jgi:hypothetical protein
MSLYDPGSGEAVRFVGVAVGPMATNIRPQDNSRITIVPWESCIVMEAISSSDTVSLDSVEEDGS